MSSHDQATLDEYLNDTTAKILSACTRCGKCVESCPVIPFADLAGYDQKEIVDGVLNSLKNATSLIDPSLRWAQQCTGCGDCIPACPEGVNPRQMIMLAATRHAKIETPTPQLFQKMARAIRLMAAMQLVPDDVRRLLQPPPTRDVDIVFYLGCNAIRTPHILFNAMYVLDAIGVEYEVLGGPSSCCGIIHSKWEGDLKRGGRITEGTLQRFGSFQPKKVLNWCPSCELHLGETVKDYRKMSFDFDHITKFLVENEDTLIRNFTTSVHMRVLLHAHEGMSELGDNVARLMRSIPGLTLVDTVREAGYTCGGSGADRAPLLKARDRAETIHRVVNSGVDAVVSLYHGCHMQLSDDGRTHGFQVVNFTDLLVRALGGEPRQDALESLRALEDWRKIANEAQPGLAANGFNIDPEALASVLPELFTLAEFRGGLETLAALKSS